MPLIVDVMTAFHVHRLMLKEPRLVRVMGIKMLPIELLLSMPQCSAMPLISLMLLMVRIGEISLIRVLLQIDPLHERRLIVMHSRQLGLM